MTFQFLVMFSRLPIGLSGGRPKDAAAAECNWRHPSAPMLPRATRGAAGATPPTTPRPLSRTRLAEAGAAPLAPAGRPPPRHFMRR